MIALRGGHVCDPGLGWDGPGDLYIRSGRIEALAPAGAAPPPGEWEVRDCAGALVVPGPIDTLCRVRLQPDPWLEGLEGVAAAAAAGGYTAILAYTGSAEAAVIAALARAELAVRLHPVAALTAGGRLADLGLLADAGAVAFSDWPEPVPDGALLRRALEYAAHLDRAVIVQAEDAGLARGGVMHEGALSFALGLRGVPAAAETAAVARDAALQRAFGGRLHFAALSAADSLPLLAGATAGVSACHLCLTEAAVSGYNTAAKLRPPLRAERDRAALLAAARAGRLLLASGHDPAPPEEKSCEYDYASFGGRLLDATLPAALGILEPAAFVRAACRGPAAAFGLPGGSLQRGAPADVAVFARDGGGPAGAGSPLAGVARPVRPVLTVLGGRVAVCTS